MPPVAVGLSLRDEFAKELCNLRDRTLVDVLEVMVDDGLGDDRVPSDRIALWRRLGARWPLVGHGTELGIGDVSGVSERYLSRLARALTNLHTHWYSDHLCFLSSLLHFAPILDDPGSLVVLTQNAKQVRAALPCPFLLENPADILGYGANQGGKGMGQTYARALLATEAGALLDLTNLVLSARNDGFDPFDFLSELPTDRIVEVHLAGGHIEEGLWIDGHDQDVDEEALLLLTEVARRAEHLRAVVIERDLRIPPLSVLLGQVEAAREALRKAGRS